MFEFYIRWILIRPPRSRFQLDKTAALENINEWRNKRWQCRVTIAVVHDDVNREHTTMIDSVEFDVRKPKIR